MKKTLLQLSDKIIEEMSKVEEKIRNCEKGEESKSELLIMSGKLIAYETCLHHIKASIFNSDNENSENDNSKDN